MTHDRVRPGHFNTFISIIVCIWCVRVGIGYENEGNFPLSSLTISPGSP